MNRYRYLKYILSMGIFFTAAGLLLAQVTPNKSLVVNGKTMPTTVVQINGHTYVDIDTVAQIANAIVTVETDRVVLTPRAAGAATASTTPPPEGVSRDFARAGVASLAEMREWRGAVGAMLSYNAPITGTWPQDYHDHVDASLAQAGLTATTGPDRDALQLLRNEFSNLSAWASGVIATRQSLNATETVRPGVAQNDPALIKIANCSNFLGTMLVSGVYTDNANCH
jgi:hypothetical protein